MNNNYKVRSSTENNNKVSLLVKAICLYLLSIPLDFIRIGSLGSISKVVAVVPLAASILYINQLRIKLNKHVILLISFALITFLSSLFSQHSSEAISNCVSMLINLFLILWLSFYDYTENEIKCIIRSIFYSGIIVSILALFFNYIGETGRTGIEVGGNSQNMNYINGYLLFPQAYALYEAMSRKRKLYYLVYVLFFFTTVITGSRGGLLASIAIYTIIFLLTVTKQKSLGKRATYLLGSLALLLLALALLKYLPESLQERYTVESIINDRGSNRILIWGSMLSSFAKFSIPNKFIGVGTGISYYYSYNQFYVAHNMYLAYLLDAGIIGLLLYSLFLIKSVLKSYKTSNYILFAALIGFMIMGMTETLTNFKPLWSVLMIPMINVKSSYQIK